MAAPATADLSSAIGQSPYQNLTPVPREGTRITAKPVDSQRDGWDLQWRKSPRIEAEQQLARQAMRDQARAAQAASAKANDHQANLIATRSAPVQQHAITQAPAGVQSPTAVPVNPIRQTSGMQVSPETPSLRPLDASRSAAVSVSQSAWMTQPTRVDDLMAPPANLTIAQTQATTRPSTNAGSGVDFFSDPFGDSPTAVQEPNAPAVPNPMAAQTPQSIADDPIDDGFLFPPPAKETTPPATRPPATRPRANDPRALELPTQPGPTGELKDSAERSERSGPSDPSLGDMLRRETPDAVKPDARPLEGADELPAPKRGNQSVDRGDLENPFPSQGGADGADLDDRKRLNNPMNRSRNSDVRREEERDARGGPGGDEMGQPIGISCSDFRERIAFQTIDKISLDISPPYRPDEMEQSRYEELKADFDEKQSIRQWRNIDGTPMASGRLRDLAYEKAIVETDFGTEEELPINQLSEADLAYISENWGLPKECLIAQDAYVPRNWTSMTMTYKASNLCHTPLYFEDVNLERYGHTHGPVLEPIVQTAHFFGNIAVLPYKMGVHAPNECTYSLGYYRPGNCAPWITPPIPISLRGALYQTAAVTGAFWLVP